MATAAALPPACTNSTVACIMTTLPISRHIHTFIGTQATRQAGTNSIDRTALDEQATEEQTRPEENHDTHNKKRVTKKQQQHGGRTPRVRVPTTLYLHTPNTGVDTYAARDCIKMVHVYVHVYSSTKKYTFTCVGKNLRFHVNGSETSIRKAYRLLRLCWQIYGLGPLIVPLAESD